MAAHKHAELMALYAQDAAETHTPWVRWQVRIANTDGWENFPEDSYGVQWHEDREYRRKAAPLEIWANITYAGRIEPHYSERSALDDGRATYQRIAIHMKEVI